MADKQVKGIPILPEAEAVAARAKLRDALKAEFRKQITHPYRLSEPGYIVSLSLEQLEFYQYKFVFYCSLIQPFSDFHP
jgi:hypothetical protein